MRPTRVTEVLKELIKSPWPVFVWGPPGVGKSSIVADVARDLDMGLIDIRASLLDPTDLRGIPAIKDGLAIWSPPAFLPHDKDSSGLLFFDELNAAPPLVQASLYQLTLDRRIGEYELPDGWRIVGAGNRAEDASIVFRMPAALSNRFVHVDYEVNTDDWVNWAATNRVHPLVISFIRLRRELLFDMSQPDRAFPTPRTWEMASDALKSFGTPKEAEDVLLGIVGEGAAMEFLGFCDNAITEEAVKAIIENPDKAKLPSELGQLYALVSYIAETAQDSTVVQAAGVLLGRLNPEFGVLLARDVLVSNPGFVSDGGYKKFVKKHASLLA
jgi:hypothetical protein